MLIYARLAGRRKDMVYVNIVAPAEYSRLGDLGREKISRPVHRCSLYILGLNLDICWVMLLPELQLRWSLFVSRGAPACRASGFPSPRMLVVAEQAVYKYDALISLESALQVDWKS